MVTGGFIGKVPVVEAEVIFETGRKTGSVRWNGALGARDKAAEIEMEEPSLAVTGGDAECAGRIAFIEIEAVVPLGRAVPAFLEIDTAPGCVQRLFQMQQHTECRTMAQSDAAVHL